jgi:probable phosphoglycerate mutase
MGCPGPPYPVALPGMRLYWFRHGQMEIRASQVADAAAIDRLFNQELEGGLSARGRAEARRVAERLRGERLDGLYASPLLRARETGEIAARTLDRELTITAALAELRTGHLAHDTWAARWVRAASAAPLRPTVKRAVLGGSLIPLYFHAWRRGRTVGGESPLELRQRVGGFLGELEARHPADATVALFAHGYLIFTLAHGLARTPWARAALWRRPHIPNGGLTEMVLERGALQLVRYADARHLDGLHRDAPST